jgi:hypothetical protein
LGRLAAILKNFRDIFDQYGGTSLGRLAANLQELAGIFDHYWRVIVRMLSGDTEVWRPQAGMFDFITLHQSKVRHLR